MLNGMTNGNTALAIYNNDPAAVAAAESARARIQSAYQVANYKPRSYETARVRILDACKRPTFAEKVEYCKPVGGTKIIGPSIRLAELALREFGNIMYENQVIYDDPSVRRVRVTVIDLETNTTFGKEIQIKKTVERQSSIGREVLSERLNKKGEKVYIVKATDEEVQVTEAALISKALRNEGLRLIPQEIIEEAIQTARETLNTQDAKDPDAAKKRVIDAFASISIMPTDLEKYLKHPIGQSSPKEIQELRSIYLSIRDGEAKWVDYISDGEPEAGNDSKEDKLKNKLLGNKKEKQKPNDTPPVEQPAPPVNNASSVRDDPAFNESAEPELLEFMTPEEVPEVKSPEEPKTNNGNGHTVNQEKREFTNKAEGKNIFGDKPNKPFQSPAEKLRDELRGLLSDSFGILADDHDDWLLQHHGAKLKEMKYEKLREVVAAINKELDARET